MRRFGWCVFPTFVRKTARGCRPRTSFNTVKSQLTITFPLADGCPLVVRALHSTREELLLQTPGHQSHSQPRRIGLICWMFQSLQRCRPQPSELLNSFGWNGLACCMVAKSPAAPTTCETRLVRRAFTSALMYSGSIITGRSSKAEGYRPSGSLCRVTWSP